MKVGLFVLIVLTLMCHLFGCFERVVLLEFNNDKIYFKEKLGSKFFQKYDQWSVFTEEERSDYFLFDVNTNLKGYGDTSNGRLSQFSFKYKNSLEMIPDAEITISTFYKKEIFSLDLSEIEDLNYCSVYDDMLFLKLRKDSFTHVQIVDLSKIKNYYSVIGDYLPVPDSSE